MMDKGTTDITDIVFSESNEEREEKSVDAIEIGEEEEKKNSSENLSPTVRDGDGDGDGDDFTSAEAKNGGILNSLISGILHPGGVGGDEGEGTAAGAGDERERGGDNDTDGGCGLIDNLVSHLPRPLADDAAPATEEASILIHSIVRD